MLTGPLKAKEALRSLASTGGVGIAGVSGASMPAEGAETEVEGPNPMDFVTGLVPERHQKDVLEAVNTAQKLAKIIPLHERTYQQAAVEKRPFTAVEQPAEELRKKAELVGQTSKVPGAKALYAAAKAPGTALQSVGKAAKAVGYAAPGVEAPSNKVLKVQNLELLRDLVGRVNETEIDVMNQLLPQFTDDDESIALKSKQRKELMLEKYNKALSTAKAFGLDLKKFPSTNLQFQTQRAQIPEAAKQYPNGAAIYNWSKKNLNDPRAKAFLKKIGEM